MASTSEVYGDPEVHPQHENYWGNVNPIGPRGVYDEAKRFTESMVMAYHRTHGLNTHIIRIFNTYGERMRLDDGRVLPNFMGQERAANRSPSTAMARKPEAFNTFPISSKESGGYWRPIITNR